ncbi:MAG: hypothetical protein ACJAXR_000055 [Halopseudomonas sp.]|jgi:hypothetical protein
MPYLTWGRLVMGKQGLALNPAKVLFLDAAARIERGSMCLATGMAGAVTYRGIEAINLIDDGTA